MDYILEMKNISKSFGEVQALRDVDFAVERNEVVGLLGYAGLAVLNQLVTVLMPEQVEPTALATDWWGVAIASLATSLAPRRCSSARRAMCQ